MANKHLAKARSVKNDEFYTQFHYIEKEINAYLEYDPCTFKDKVVLLPCDDPEWSHFTHYFILNFESLGLKKLISTCIELNGEPAKKFVMEKEDIGKVKPGKIHYECLEGNGDYRSMEITELRDEADIIVTNPPFSKFKDFFAWIMNGNKLFLVIGNQNAITYSEVFPYIKRNRVWLGATNFSEDMVFEVPEGVEVKQEYKEKAERLGYKGNYTRLGNSCWFTNLDHGRRHMPIPLMTTRDNMKYSKHKELRGKTGYSKYENYEAIEVPYNDAIPYDYEGVMGVPITFLDKYCPEQFEIIGATESEGIGFSNGLWNPNSKSAQAIVNGTKVYKRIFIRKNQ